VFTMELVYTGDLTAAELGSVPTRVALVAAAGDVFRIGRANDNDAFLFSSALPDAVRTTVSRYHAQVLVRAGGALALVDLGSMNGTFVDGVRVAAQAEVPIGDGSVVVFGGARGRGGARGGAGRGGCAQRARALTHPRPPPRRLRGH